MSKVGTIGLDLWFINGKVARDKVHVHYDGVVIYDRWTRKLETLKDDDEDFQAVVDYSDRQLQWY